MCPPRDYLIKVLDAEEALAARLGAQQKYERPTLWHVRIRQQDPYVSTTHVLQPQYNAESMVPDVLT